MHIAQHSRPLLAALVVCAACSGPAEAPDPVDLGPAPAVEAPAPWTDVFSSDTTVFAEEITIEGPAGLRSHLALRQDEGSYDYDLETTERGLVQTLAMKPGASLPTVDAHLDNWKLRAFERIVVIELPRRDGEVVLRARGEAAVYGPDSERRMPVFELRARVGR